jgi:hypothetical protein
LANHWPPPRRSTCGCIHGKPPDAAPPHLAAEQEEQIFLFFFGRGQEQTAAKGKELG